MSEYGAYDDPPRRYKTTRTRPRERGEPEYMEETTFIERGKGPPPRELMYRPRARNLEREDSVEDIQRDFPPPEARRPARYRDDHDAPPPRRAKSQVGRRDDYDDYDDYGPPVAAGAAAGYAAGRRGGGRGDRGRDDRDYYQEQRGGRGRDRYPDDESQAPRRKRSKSQSGLEKTLEGLGLGGIVGAITGNNGNKRDERERGYGSDRSRSRSRPRGGNKERQWAQAAQAALVAGAVEAFRARNDPGPWTGEKGRKIATAAIAAGGIDRLVDKNPEEKSKRHLVEAVLGGLAANRLANGPTNREGPDGDDRGRSRSRSRSVLDRFRSKSRKRSGSEDSNPRGGQRDGLKDLAAGGALAAVGKALFDKVQERSKSKSRRRSPSESSDDSYVPSRNRRRDVGDSRRDLPPPSRNPNDTAVAARAPRNGGQEGPRGRNGERGMEVKKRDSSSSSMSSTDLEEKCKKMKGKEYLTAALASIATIHAAHGVYQSMESSDKRHKLVSEGEMTQEEARKKRSKAWMQDAAAVGIAALGIKGAYSEWKEMTEQRHEMKELEERREKRQKRRKRREREQEKGRPGNGGGGGGGGGRAPYYPPAPQPYGAPYYSGNVPPPPMGYQPNGRYA